GERQLQKRLREHVCRHCGLHLSDRPLHVSFCSSSCFEAFQRERERERSLRIHAVYKTVRDLGWLEQHAPMRVVYRAVRDLGWLDDSMFNAESMDTKSN